MRNILTPKQTLFLSLFSASNLAKKFYFTGGTALSHYYLHHRLSEDLDFFNTQEFKPLPIQTFLKTIKNKLQYQSIDFQSSFNRYLFQIRFHQSFLKAEFTYFPFNQIESPLKKDHILIDSLTDIAVNKLFTINQNPRGRDYFDLFFIIQKQAYTLENLRKLAKIKFDWHIDPLQLGSQLNRVAEFIDDPILLKSASRTKMINFFKSEAKNLKSKIIKF